MPGEKKVRGQHKPDCQCPICRRKREKEALSQAEAAPAPVVPKTTPPVPPAVRLDTLNAADYFIKDGKRYRVGNKETDCIVCSELQFFDNGPLPTDKMWRVVKTVTLATFTMVKPIK
jgi:hypothetical protein